MIEEEIPVPRLPDYDGPDGIAAFTPESTIKLASVFTPRMAEPGAPDEGPIPQPPYVPPPPPPAPPPPPQPPDDGRQRPWDPIGDDPQQNADGTLIPPDPPRGPNLPVPGNPGGQYIDPDGPGPLPPIWVPDLPPIDLPDLPNLPVPWPYPVPGPWGPPEPGARGGDDGLPGRGRPGSRGERSVGPGAARDIPSYQRPRKKRRG